MPVVDEPLFMWGYTQLEGADEDSGMRETFANIGISIVTNTALFTGLDLGQWIADEFSLWSLPANVIAAIIATTIGLALTAASRVLRVRREAESGVWRGSCDD
jgi:hypothetical protein